MLHPIKLANAATIVFVIYYIVLVIIATAIPDLAFTAPGYGVSTDDINWGYLILGLVIAAVIVWILVFATISIYNKLL